MKFDAARSFRIASFIIGFLVIFFSIYIVVLYTLPPSSLNVQSTQEINLDNDIKSKLSNISDLSDIPTDDEFYVKMFGMNFSDIKLISKGYFNSPNINQAAISKKFNEKTFDKRKQLITNISYMGDSFSKKDINIMQGDILTIKNENDSPIVLSLKDTDLSFEIDKGMEVSQQFDFTGEYTLSVNESDQSLQVFVTNSNNE